MYANKKRNSNYPEHLCTEYIGKAILENILIHFYGAVG
jgi:hypothetical protein